MIVHLIEDSILQSFSKNGSVVVDLCRGMTVNKKNLLVLLKRLETYERKTKSILSFHARWFSDHRKCKVRGTELGEITTFRKNLLRYFERRRMPEIKHKIQKYIYTVSGKLKFREVISKAREVGIYEEFSWLEGLLLGITAIEKGFLEENNKSIYVFLSTRRNKDGAPCMLRFYRYGESWLRVDVDKVPFKLLTPPNVVIIGTTAPILN